MGPVARCCGLSCCSPSFSDRQSKGAWLAGLAAIVLLFALPFVYAMYKAIEWRWWVSGIRFGDVRFESDMQAAPN